mgnify:CR=1 FL=1
MIKVAYDARDYMFHALVQVQYDETKGKHGTLLHHLAARYITNIFNL